MENIKIQAGALIISKPEPGDPRFETSVSLICDHDENGSFALALNKPTEFFINIEDFSVSDEALNQNYFPLWMGGPVQVDRCFFLFAHHQAIDGAEKIVDGLYLSFSKTVLETLAKETDLKSLNLKFFLGYAGWSFYQLDCEISYGWWLLALGDKSSPFHPNPSQQWLESLKSINDDYYEAGLKFLKSN